MEREQGKREAYGEEAASKSISLLPSYIEDAASRLGLLNPRDASARYKDIMRRYATTDVTEPYSEFRGCLFPARDQYSVSGAGILSRAVQRAELKHLLPGRVIS